MSIGATAAWYRWFAEHEAAGSSPSYERLALAIADDDTILARLDELPRHRRQPNLVLAACRYLGADMVDTRRVVEFIRERWAEVAAVARQRSTQTNEAARTAVFAPALATLPRPIALIEVGASAGLCLYPDRYRITYGGTASMGPPDAPVHIEVATNGRVPLAAGPLEIVWRAGIDLSPLDAGDPDDVAWLEACIWPEHMDRSDRLQRAAAMAANDPPLLVRGDLIESLDDLLAQMPAAATPVVFHSAVFNYLEPERRLEATELLRSHDVVWLSNEADGVMPGVESAGIEPLGPGAHFVLAEGSARTLALSHPHGRWLAWGSDTG